MRLDGVVTVIDADAMVRYPSTGHTSRMQIEAADTILLNKVDLVSDAELKAIAQKLHSFNEAASVLYTRQCQVDPGLLFGISRERMQAPPHHVHQPEFESFSYKTSTTLARQCFADFADCLETDVYRAKGFVCFSEGTYLFNFVAGRWDLEPFEPEATELVFIGKQVSERKAEILSRLKLCEVA